LLFDQYEAVSGDASCGGLVINGSRTKRSLGICISQEANGNFPDPADIDEPVTGWKSISGARGLMNGYHDMHIHLFADLSHGGKVLSGLPAPVDDAGNFVLNDTYNVNTALSAKNDKHLHKTISHGLGNDTTGDGTQDGTRSWFGAPYFNGWPKWTSTTHQQMYYVWLERAWRGGLRSTSMLAVHNEALCKTSLKDTKEESWPLCEDSMSYIVDQLKAAFKFQDFIDERSGGEGKGWFQIVKTPEQARQVISDGKLAVILGIEVDNLFNCKEIKGCPEDFGLPLERIESLTSLPEPTTVEEAVNVLHDIGVIHVLPVHNFDNGFGAAATWHDAIGVGQLVSEERWWEVEECDTFDGGRKYGFWIDTALYPVLIFAGFGDLRKYERYDDAGDIPTYPKVPSCNKYGLLGEGNSELHPGGERLINALMAKGMLIDIDHMSRKSIDDTLDIVKKGIASTEEPYPLVASHVLFTSLHKPTFEGNKGRHERLRTREHVDAIKDTGGIIAVMLKDDVQDTDLKGKKYTKPFTGQDYGNSIADNCRHSSKTFAQALQYATDAMGGPVTLGSDFNGSAGHIGPRFGSDACGGWHRDNLNGHERVKQIAEDNKISYPFTLEGYGKFNKQKTGFKSFDYNVDGLAHVGLLPDMIADLKKIGLHSHYIDQLFCSSEAYIRVWERAEAIAKGETIPDRDRAWQCNERGAPTSSISFSPEAFVDGWYGRNTEITITATDEESGVKEITFGQAINLESGNPTILKFTTAGDIATFKFSEGLENQVRIAFFAIDTDDNQEETHQQDIKIDLTLPEITATKTSVNSNGWNNTPVSVIFVCSDSLSNIQSCTPKQIISTEGENQKVVGEAVDNAGNRKETSENLNIDLTSPQIIPMQTPDANTNGWNNVPVSVTFTCTDALSGTLSCSGGAVKNAEGENQLVYGKSEDKAGNLSSKSVSINIDKTSPTITATRAPLANNAGWNNNAVTASFTCNDTLSGIGFCTPDKTISANGASQSIPGQAVDKAGNNADTIISGINIDITPPIVSITGVTNGDVYTLGSVPVAGCDTSDALSGVAVSAVVSVTGGNSKNVGSYSVNCDGAQDVADNTNSASANYAVHYAFSGIFIPGKGDDSLPKIKAGRAIPLKFGLNGDFGLSVLQDGSPTSVKIHCSTGAMDGLEEIAVIKGNKKLTYSPDNGLYQFKWDTAKSWKGTCRRLLLKLDDGSTHSSDFRFK